MMSLKNRKLTAIFISKGDFRMNLKTKRNTVKQILARVMLIILLLTCIFNFAGCIKSKVYIYIAHDNIVGNSYILEKRLSVEKIEYFNSDVTVDLSLGIHELNIWGENKPEIITELDYLTESEVEEAEKKLGMFQGDFSISNGKSRMQSIVSGIYRWSETAEITILVNNNDNMFIYRIFNTTRRYSIYTFNKNNARK